MPTAYVHLPPHVEERRAAFINGFARLGFIVEQQQPCVPLGPLDACVAWNRTARSHQSVEMARKGGGALIVAENGYYGKDSNGFQPYALALDGHNGSGRWFVGDVDRLDALAIPFKPYRPQEGEKVLIAAQRGIGSPQMRSPPNFDHLKAQELVRAGFRPAVRQHPGRNKPQTTLLEDLEEARCLVVWSSNCATEALINGIPTYFCAPEIVTKGAALRLTPTLSSRFTEERREQAFHRLAWAQWFLAEIEHGDALDTLLSVHRGKLPYTGGALGL